jgi:Rrf2 family protein
MISTKGRYALGVMIDLAIYSEKEYVSLKDISRRTNISYKYLEQVISLLNRAGLVKSLRGNNGGYQLNKSPKDILAYDIIIATEGNISISDSVNKDINASINDFWNGLDKTIENYLKSVNLTSLKDKYLDSIQIDYSI